MGSASTVGGGSLGTTAPLFPLPDGQLGAIVEVMLGTSARIGEVLAIRRRDFDFTGAVPSIRLAGTSVSRNGEQTFRQDHPKTAKSRRVVALPSFTSDAVRRRLADAGRLELDSLLFYSRDGTLLTTANVRRQLRRVLGGAGSDGVTRARSAARWRQRSTTTPVSSSRQSCSATPTRGSRCSTTSNAVR